jgi:hypothetical protein
MMSSPIPSERPIFIVGAPRSGTTLLRYVLCAHPDIYIPPESNFMLRFLSQAPARSLSRSQAIGLMNDVLAYKVFFRDWQEELPDVGAFVDGLPNRRPRTLLRALYGEYARQHGARRWGDKSPIYAERVAEIAKLFPAAQFVHIIRDGRDVALSMLKAYQGLRFFYIDLCYAALSWRRRVRVARRDSKALGPDRALELRYEWLTTRPKATLDALCNFLGESFSPKMMSPHQMAAKQYHSKGIHGATRHPFFTGSVGRWRNEMSSSDRRLFQVLAGGALADLGYEQADMGVIGIAERVRLVGLRTKYAIVELVRRSLRAAGVVHPATLAVKLLNKLHRRN